MISFTKDLFTALDALNTEDQVEILKATVTYTFDGVEPEFDGVKKAIWILSKDYLNHNRDKFLNNKVEKNLETRSKVFRKPSVPELVNHIREKNPNADPKKILEFAEQFHSFYESKDWKIGKSPMKNWVAALRTWKETMEKVLYPKMISHNTPAKGSWEYRQMEYLKGVQSIMTDESL